MRASLFIPCLVTAVTVCSLSISQADGGPSVVPKPLESNRGIGQTVLSGHTRVLAESRDAAKVARFLSDGLSGLLGSPVEVRTEEMVGGDRIILRLDPASADLGPEGYRISIDGADVTVRALRRTGLFYGVQTLLQLCKQDTTAQKMVTARRIVLPCLAITDRPRFGWRGLMLDCSRTFLPIPYLRRYIDLMASLKMNVLHLHLTDDQGWRMQIRKYPKLTTIGAEFSPQYKDKGGFYSQSEMRSLVVYAQDRGVTIVPEIEMPGHSLAALAAYPELSCSGGPFEVKPVMAGPPDRYDVFCVGNDATVRFFEGVLAEVMEIFPSRYIHVGGDEVPRDLWARCPNCQARMKSQGLKSTDELQSWFMKRIERFIRSKGRSLLGWDEIMDGGLAPEATVMSWRGVEPGTKALRQGHDVVFAPTSHCYFDYPYEVTSTERTYSFEPLPSDLTGERLGKVLGVQACMWTHIARTEPEINRQILPRMVALAEVCWSDPKNRDYDDFKPRLTQQLKYLDSIGMEYYTEPEPRAYTKGLLLSFDFDKPGVDGMKSSGQAEIALQPEKADAAAELRDGGPSGSGRYLHIPADAVLRGSDKDRVLDLRMTPFLVEAWVRNPGQPDRQYGSTIMSFGQAGPGGWRFGIDAKGRAIFTLYGIYDATGPNSIIPVDGRWHHLAVNLRKDRRLLYFVDGKLTDTLEMTSFAAGAMEPVVLLGNDIGHVTHFEGDVDRIRISAGEFDADELDCRP